jgi:hypothetical protein
LVARTPAKIAFEGVTNFFVGGVGVVLEQSDAGDDHAGGAKAALQAMFLPKSILDGVKRAILGQTFDRCNTASIGLHGEHRTRFDNDTVQQHVTRAALTGVTANVGACQAQILPKKVDQQESGFNVTGTLHSINGN